jgi:catechol 2,3-dioxygenase-like lactoylglutathione lyase family enzyme
MTIQRMEHVGIVVDDLAAATEFFVELGLVMHGEGPVDGRWVDRVVGLEGVRVDCAMLRTPDGHGRLELLKVHSTSNQGGHRHAPANTQGLRHMALAVEDIDAVVARLRARGSELVGKLERHEDSYRLCYVRGHHRASGEGRVRCRLSEVRRLPAGRTRTLTCLTDPDHIVHGPAAGPSAGRGRRADESLSLL